jgi:hypothetical protein
MWEGNALSWVQDPAARARLRLSDPQEPEHILARERIIFM